MKVLSIAEKEVGYIEKESNKDLEPKAGSNAGDGNYTKYARDLIEAVGKPFMNGVPWCVIFIFWCFLIAYGVEEAKRLLHRWTMSCTELMTSFKARGQFKDSPQVGDIVIFGWKDSKGVQHRHTGLVYKVDIYYIYTIEGNTSGKANTVIENGGGVFKKSYRRNNPRIEGYCRPDYIVIPTPVLKRGKKNAPEQVKLLQEELNGLGYTDAEGKVLDIDGSFGRRTEEAVKSFQKAEELVVDGSYGPKTAAMLKSVLTEEAEKDGK